MWRHRGSPAFLDEQAKRFGIAPVLARQAAHNPEIYQCSVLLGQLCERWHKSRKEHGKPVLGRLEINQIEGTLGQAEDKCKKLHMLAGAAAAMIDEAYEAFGITRPKRMYEILDDLPRTLPLGDGTVGVAGLEPAAALAESG
jgi:hypothetical protein